MDAFGIFALEEVELQPEDGMQGDLQDGNGCNPSVKTEESRMRPVGHPDENVVASSVQEDQTHVGHTQNRKSIREDAFNEMLRIVGI